MEAMIENLVSSIKKSPRRNTLHDCTMVCIGSQKSFELLVELFKDLKNNDILTEYTIHRFFVGSLCYLEDSPDFSPEEISKIKNLIKLSHFFGDFEDKIFDKKSKKYLKKMLESLAVIHKESIKLWVSEFQRWGILSQIKSFDREGQINYVRNILNFKDTGNTKDIAPYFLNMVETYIEKEAA
jgi:hypothetical protein